MLEPGHISPQLCNAGDEHGGVGYLAVTAAHFIRVRPLIPQPSLASGALVLQALFRLFPILGRLAAVPARRPDRIRQRAQGQGCQRDSAVCRSGIRPVRTGCSGHCLGS
jgi:hypothetical protein